MNKYYILLLVLNFIPSFLFAATRIETIEIGNITIKLNIINKEVDPFDAQVGGLEEISSEDVKKIIIDQLASICAFFKCDPRAKHQTLVINLTVDPGNRSGSGLRTRPNPYEKEFFLTIGGKTTGETELVLRHEMTHLMLKVIDDKPKIIGHYLEEALGDYLEGSSLLEKRAQGLILKAPKEQTFTFYEMLNVKNKYKQEDHYAASARYLLFIKSEYGDDAIKKIITASQKGIIKNSDLKAILGINFEEFNRKFFEWQTNYQSPIEKPLSSLMIRRALPC